MGTTLTRAAALGATLVVGITGSAAALPSFGTAPVTGIGTGGTTSPVNLVSVTSGRNAGFDRLVFRFAGATPSRWRVEYVPQPVQDGSGFPIRMLGRRYLQVTFSPAHSPAHTFRFAHTPLLPTLRQVRSAGDFEAMVTMVAGLSRRAPFRTFRLSRPPRIVVDVRH